MGITTWSLSASTRKHLTIPEASSRAVYVTASSRIINISDSQLSIMQQLCNEESLISRFLPPSSILTPPQSSVLTLQSLLLCLQYSSVFTSGLYSVFSSVFSCLHSSLIAPRSSLLLSLHLRLQLSLHSSLVAPQSSLLSLQSSSDAQKGAVSITCC